MKNELRWRRKAVAGLAAAGLYVSAVNAGAVLEPPGGLTLVRIPGGSFRMGSVEAEQDDAPREVVVREFWMAPCEVTVEEFAEFLNDTGAIGFTNCPEIVCRGTLYRPAWFSARKPARGVSFSQALAYARWLAQKSGARVRLPDEAEWEYAARGGIQRARYPWGWGDPQPGHACFDRPGPCRTGSYPPNPWGLYDLAGNVFEWCAKEDASAPTVARGGAFSERDPRFLRVFYRTVFPPGYADADIGFRIVADAGKPR